ncbi:hypothetical protein KP509_04G052600 [Ceratopteris richardii]|uniref:Uncharacterized protein n=1 Tax=Ceratopteris richardii TaxID=49495 RepID=A0A8T2V4T0_CERRI|nr:hypothetical protein KP509_04G052600 [Ceratopteris richardii]KAH7439260.1 hypothetical protein KP509_04G052600 [Ceratopteris richardii]
MWEQYRNMHLSREYASQLRMASAEYAEEMPTTKGMKEDRLGSGKKKGRRKKRIESDENEHEEEELQSEIGLHEKGEDDEKGRGRRRVRKGRTVDQLETRQNTVERKVVEGKKEREKDRNRGADGGAKEERKLCEEQTHEEPKGEDAESRHERSEGAKRRSSSERSMFADGFKERRDLEQYFWSENTVMQLKEALRPTSWQTQVGHVCCLAVPSLAHAFYYSADEGGGGGRIEALLDIDTRFEYLPGFRFFDLCHPVGSESADDDFRIVVFDPPFFYIPLQVLFEAVVVAVQGNLEAKLLLGFLRREERALLSVFAPFRLRRTRFVLEYANVKPNKWRNYALYSNIDLPGIKRITS